jgi:hypothetical protein
MLRKRRENIRSSRVRVCCLDALYLKLKYDDRSF